MGEAQREKENAHCEEAKTETTQDVDALEDAVDVSGEAIEAHKEGTLFQAKTGSRWLDSLTDQHSGEKV